MKLAIVNDSKMAVEALRRVLANLASFEIVWIAYSGEDAVRMAKKERPDIILMDLIMPGIDGAETTRQIMKATPCVILVVTATTVGNRDKVFEAMGYGALDAVNTPVLGADGDMSGAEPLLQKLRMVSRLVAPVKAQTHPASGTHVATQALKNGADIPIVAIGASTGGPQALSEILTHLPQNFPAAILVSQHVDEHFAPGLATWLQHHSPMPVKIANAHEPLRAGMVWLAGSSDHMMYEPGGQGFVTYTRYPVETAYRPSVDVLFASLAGPHSAPRVGVLLTGMGRDGGEGLLALRKAGGLTIAQDAETSVVYGMPRAAAELGAAMEILPLKEIGPRIRKAILHP